jgi:hypothetical protein
MRLFCILLLALLIGCGVRERTPRVYAEWGRGSLQGVATRGGEIGVVARADGSLVMLAWFGRDDQSAEVVHIQTVDNDNQIRSTLPISLDGESPSDLQLIAHDDELAAAWIVQVDRLRVLRIVPFGWDGALGENRVVISAENSDVRWYRIQSASQGGFYLFWLDENDHLFGEWHHNGGSERIFEQSDVKHADFAEAADATLHLIWLSAENRLNYTQLSATSQRTRSSSDLILTANGLTLLLDETVVTVSWIDQPAQQILAINFPITGIESAEWNHTDPTAIPLPGGYPPVQTGTASATFPSSLSSGLGDAAPAGGQLVSLRGQRAEAILTTTLWLETRNHRQAQPVIIYFQAGILTGYQMLSWTQGKSDGVAISADANNHLYVGWIDVLRGDNPVYLITTQPTLRDAASRLAAQDYRVIARDGFGRILQAFGLIFVVLPWLLTPVFYFCFVVAIVYGNTNTVQARNAFLLGIILYEGVKYWFGLRGDVPLMRFIPNMGLLDPARYTTFVYAIPPIILAVCLIFVWLFYIRRAREVVHSTWFIFVILLDYTLSLAFYALAYFA